MCLKVPALESRGVWPDMLKYLTKFALDVLPSVVATILGAYIVNHYINTKSDADAPAAAVVSAADPKNQKVDPKNDAKSLETAKIPEPGVKAKGISERAMIEKSASEGPAEVKPVETKPAENKPAEVKPAETAIAPAEPRRAPPAREKALAKATPNPVTAPVATANPAPAAEANAMPEERRGTHDLARAPIQPPRGAPPQSQDATPQPAHGPHRTHDPTIGHTN